MPPGVKDILKPKKIIKKISWFNSVKTLWGVIGLLIVGIVSFIVYNKTLVADIALLKEELAKAKTNIDLIQNSELRTLREWQWTITGKLAGANIITIEGGVIQ